MRVALVTTVLASAALAAAPAGAAGAKTGAPTAKQIAQAMRTAQRSPKLWATINICNSRSHRDVLGVRGQMPALGFPAALSMVVDVSRYSPAEHRFVANATRTVSLGTDSTGLQQDGAEFQYAPHAGRLTATIQFIWKRGATQLGLVTRRTTGGHRDADFGSPAHYSAASCTIS